MRLAKMVVAALLALFAAGAVAGAASGGSISVAVDQPDDGASWF